jgi:hypothetical protein
MRPGELAAVWRAQCADELVVVDSGSADRFLVRIPFSDINGEPLEVAVSLSSGKWSISDLAATVGRLEVEHIRWASSPVRPRLLGMLESFGAKLEDRQIVSAESTEIPSLVELVEFAQAITTVESLALGLSEGRGDNYSTSVREDLERAVGGRYKVTGGVPGVPHATSGTPPYPCDATLRGTANALKLAIFAADTSVYATVMNAAFWAGHLELGRVNGQLLSPNLDVPRLGVMSTRNKRGSTAWQLLAPHVTRIVQHTPGEGIESLAEAALDLAA